MHSQLQPLGVSTREVIRLTGGKSKLLKRAVAAPGWIKPALPGGRGNSSVFDYEDVTEYWNRLKAGERPPPLPCEVYGPKEPKKPKTPKPKKRNKSDNDGSVQ